jgi:hypothetical protein
MRAMTSLRDAWGKWGGSQWKSKYLSQVWKFKTNYQGHITCFLLLYQTVYTDIRESLQIIRKTLVSNISSHYSHFEDFLYERLLIQFNSVHQ